MDNEKPGWKQFKRIKLDRKQLSRRAKKIEGATQRHAHRFVIRRIDNIKMVAREITIWLTAIAVIIAGMGLQLFWGQSAYMHEVPANDGVYVEGVIGEIDTLNPLYVSTNSEASVSRLVFSSLYNYDSKGSLHQDIATAMTVDAARKVYTVTIRSDAKWHDGEVLTAKDIVFTINLIKNPTVRSPLRVNWTDVAVSAPNDTTVQFTLPATYAAFPHALTFPILPIHLLEKVAPAAFRESPYSASPVGSGPFSFRLLRQADATGQNKVVHLAANSSYYGGAPKLKRFEVHTFTDNQAMVKALKVGELSGANDVSPLSLDQLSGGHFNRVAAATDSGVYALFNLTNPVLKDAALRKALQVGTDTNAVRQAIGGDQLPLDLPVLHSQLKGADVPHAPAYDQTKAKAMLDAAGWKLLNGIRQKDGVKLELTLTTIKNAEYEHALDSLDKQWQALGVLTHRNIVDTSSLASTFVQNTLQARNFDVLLYELAIGADPDVYAYWHSSQIGQSGYNFSSYSNKTADANLASARSRIEPDLRDAKYRQFVGQWLEDAPAIGLYQPVIEYVTSDGAMAIDKGAQLPTAADRYANVLYWSVGQRAVYKTP